MVPLPVLRASRRESRLLALLSQRVFSTWRQGGDACVKSVQNRAHGTAGQGRSKTERCFSGSTSGVAAENDTSSEVATEPFGSPRHGWREPSQESRRWLIALCAFRATGELGSLTENEGGDTNLLPDVEEPPATAEQLDLGLWCRIWAYGRPCRAPWSSRSSISLPRACTFSATRYSPRSVAGIGSRLPCPVCEKLSCETGKSHC